jgi:MipA family protein
VKAATGVLSALLLAATAGSALSADLAATVPPSAQSTWIATVGARITVDPTYPGADKYSVWGSPVVGLRRSTDPEWFSALDDSASFGISVTDWLRVGVAGDYLDGRDRGDDSRLRGLKPIDWTVELGGFFELWPTDYLRARVEIKKGINGHDGVTADIGFDAIVPVTNNLSLAFGPRVDLATTDYMRTYYGVTAREAARSPFINRSFRPDGGIESAGLAASVTYKWDENWTTTIGGGWDRLVGDAADSPVTRRAGTPNQFWGGARVAYSFNLPDGILPGF